MEKLIHNSPPPLSHNIGYMLFTPYSQRSGILLYEATPGTLYVWGFYYLDTVVFSPPSDSPPSELIVVFFHEAISSGLQKHGNPSCASLAGVF
mgnify:CR=1 FL=1